MGILKTTKMKFFPLLLFAIESAISQEFKVTPTPMDQITEMDDTLYSYRQTISTLIFEAKLKSMENNLQDKLAKLEKQNSEMEKSFKEKLVQLEKQNIELKEQIKNLEKQVDNKSNFPAFEVGKSIHGLENEFGMLKEMIGKQQNVSHSTEISMREIYGLESKINQLTKTVENQQNTAKLAEGSIHQLNSQIKVLKDSSQKKSVIFQASLVNGFSNVGKYIPFSSVQINVGSGYDPKTGVFKAPFSGTFLFITACQTNSINGKVNSYNPINGKVNSETFLDIIHNGRIIRRAYGNTNIAILSSSFILKLNVNDQVAVKLGGGSVTSDAYNRTYFLGILL